MGLQAAKKMQQLAEKNQQQDEDEDFEVSPENWDTVQLWEQIAYVWEYGPFGGLISLNWNTVNSILEGMKKYENLEVTPNIYRGLRLMESVVIPLLNEKIRSKT